MRPLLALLTALAFAVFGAPAFAQKTSPVIDFTYVARDSFGNVDPSRRAYEYAFGDWGDNKVKSIPNKGLLVNHLGSKGGVGANKKLALKDATKAVVVFVIGNGNQADAFNFALTDADGTEHTFRIPLADQPRGQVLTALLLLDQSKQEDKPGTKPGLDLKKLKSWQIKGDFGDKAIELMLQKVLAYRDA